VGRIEPANPIYLSFMCGNPMGVAIHETLHALGLQHEQLRIGELGLTNSYHGDIWTFSYFVGLWTKMRVDLFYQYNPTPIADRDKFITVNWENVNPQQYDFFAVSDMTKFSTYGKSKTFNHCPQIPPKKRSKI
jgi:astacin